MVCAFGTDQPGVKQYTHTPTLPEFNDYTSRRWPGENETQPSLSVPSSTMDIHQAVAGYITKMVSTGDTGSNGGGPTKMKILLLDTDTVPIVSSVTTQSALLSHSVYLTDRLEAPDREKMRHLRCLCFLRPSPASVEALVDEFRNPKYGEYHICEYDRR